MKDEEKDLGLSDNVSEVKRTVRIAIVGTGAKVLQAAVSQVLAAKKIEHIDMVCVDDGNLDRLKTAKEEPFMVVAANKPRNRGDLAAFAEQLINMTTEEVQKLAQTLEEEYGIIPASARSYIFEDRPEPLLPEVVIRKPRRKERNYYVPKKIGRVHSKPKK